MNVFMLFKDLNFLFLCINSHLTSSRVTVLCVSVCLIGFGDFGLRWPRFLAGLFLATLDATLNYNLDN